jgi:hypothetical protein
LPLGFIDKIALLKDNIAKLSNFSFIVIADNLDSVAFTRIKKIRTIQIIETSLGNNGSFLRILDMLDKFEDDDLLYLLEDDYFHYQGITKSEIDVLFRNFDYLTLFNHPDKTPKKNQTFKSRYCKGNFSENLRLFMYSNNYWHTSSSTTMTFMTRAITLKRDRFIWRIFIGRKKIPRDCKIWTILLQPFPSGEFRFFKKIKYLIIFSFCRLLKKPRILGVPLKTISEHLDHNTFNSKNRDFIRSYFDNLNSDQI